MQVRVLSGAPFTAIVAQLVRAQDCGSWGREFEPRQSPHKYNNMRYVLLFLVCISTLYGQYRAVIPVSDNYRITFTDGQCLIIFSNVKTPTVKLSVPSEGPRKNQMFSAGTFITGTALTESTVIIEGDPGVLIIGLDNAVRSKGFGSSWTLRRVGKNTWSVSGDLYSLDQSAYIGDDITLRAAVNQLATGPFSYVWYKNDQILPNASLASLKLSNIQVSDAGFYQVKVFNYNKTKEISSETINLLVR